MKPEELKIDKNSMNFFDILNISMGRVTSSNAHMCVRSEKITRAQLNKLQMKYDKYANKDTDDCKGKIKV